MQGGSKLPPVLIRPLTIRKMTVIDEGRELYQVKLSLTMKSVIINVETRARLVKAWETMS